MSKCINFEICNKYTFTNRPCINCNDMYGVPLQFIDNHECPICMETERCVKFINCNHYVCIQDFKRMFYGNQSDEPKFPYPDLEDDYYENIKKYVEDPNVIKWTKEWHNWSYLEDLHYESEQYLRKCSICRS